MIELFDGHPEIAVQAEEFHRLLGYPPGHELAERPAELAQWVREWYARNGQPWVFATQAEDVAVNGSGFEIGGSRFESPRLRKTLADAEASSVALVAVCAGAELEVEAQNAWRDGKPDEYFFLETYGSAVVEYLTTTTGARLCAWADGRGLAVLPHYSPGYPEWDIAEQPRLFDVMRRRGLRAEIDVLESGAMRPKKSLLAVFGVTARTEHLRRLTDLVPCENCSMPGCQFRRVPYHRAVREPASGPFAQPAVRYTVNPKALRRWASERLTLAKCPDGSTAAQFRYDGTTCTNSGTPLTFLYDVKLGRESDGYPVLEQHCRPAPGDSGYTRMCRYQEEPVELMTAIDCEKPLAGKPVAEVLGWQRASCPAGCYCDREARDHKWGLVLETIHFALHGERSGRS
jgi:hypothetical protein